MHPGRRSVDSFALADLQGRPIDGLHPHSRGIKCPGGGRAAMYWAGVFVRRWSLGRPDVRLLVGMSGPAPPAQTYHC